MNFLSDGVVIRARSGVKIAQRLDNEVAPPLTSVVHLSQHLVAEGRDHDLASSLILANQVADNDGGLSVIVAECDLGVDWRLHLYVQKHVRARDTQLQQVFQGWHTLAHADVDLSLELRASAVEDELVFEPVFVELSVVAAVHDDWDVVFG